jgi:predicted house-cleaning noncanonical NTP pyrophosphatase (MazG superfamily)
MRSYNKLVRDNIPNIISKNGEKPITRVLTDEEYIRELNLKIEEEVKEYLLDFSVEELADIEEVIRAILDYKNVSYEEFENVRLNKVNKRGAFKERIFLERVEDEK